MAIAKASKKPEVKKAFGAFPHGTFQLGGQAPRQWAPPSRTPLGRHHHGQPVGLAHHAPCRRPPWSSWASPTRPESSPPTAHPSRMFDYARNRPGARPQGDHRRRRRCRPPARHDRIASPTCRCFGVPVESAALKGQDSAPLHRADAGRHPGRHPRHRPRRRGQCRPARRRRSWRLTDAQLAASARRLRASRPRPSPHHPAHAPVPEAH